MGIAENIKRYRKRTGLTQEELAEKLDVARSTITQWETGWSSPRMSMLQRLSDVFGISPSALFEENDGQRMLLDAIAVYPSAEVTAPLFTLGRVHAGDFADGEETERRVEVPASVLAKHPRAFALTVEGNCMDRVIPEGSHVLVDPDREPRNGSIAVIEIETHQVVMRRWYRGSSTLMLAADSHEDQKDMVFGEEDGPVSVVGTVVWYQAPGEMG